MTVLPIRTAPDEAGAGKVVQATQKAIDALPFDSGMWRVEGIPGLYVRCWAQTKSFRLERRVDGVLLKKTLRAETVKQAKAAALTEWTRMKPHPAPAGVTTLHMAVEQYLEGKVPELASKTVEIARYNLGRYLKRWKDRSLSEIGGDRAGIRTLQQVITKKHGRSTSNQVIRLLAAVYRWHQDTNQDLADWPRKAAAIHKIKSRQWAYTPDELRAWWYQTRKEKDGAVTELGVKTLGPINQEEYKAKIAAKNATTKPRGKKFG